MDGRCGQQSRIAVTALLGAGCQGLSCLFCEMGYQQSGRQRGPRLKPPAVSRSEHTPVGAQGAWDDPGLRPEGREKPLSPPPASPALEEGVAGRVPVLGQVRF